jgi:hypothetical protein
MKKLGIFVTILSILCFISFGYHFIKCEYEFQKEISSYWNMADKSSTIVEKRKNIDIFVTKFERSGLDGRHNAIVLKTLDNSFDGNLRALKSLQHRLHEIENMDVSSFEYQTAIQQITQQEQGEAHKMLCELRGVWVLNYYPLLWSWVGMLSLLWSMGMLLLGIYIWNKNFYN